MVRVGVGRMLLTGSMSQGGVTLRRPLRLAGNPAKRLCWQ
jgi:hypothetical protein